MKTYIYILSLLLTPTPLFAYHNHHNGFEFLLGVLLLIVIIPILKLLGYLLLMILRNKWTWIIGGVILLLLIISSVESDKTTKNDSYPTDYHQQYPNSYHQHINTSPIIPQAQKTPIKKQRTETYKDACYNCRGTGVTICHHCDGEGFIDSTCTFCKGTGGKKDFRCLSCSGSGINPITGKRCISCSGTGYEETHCYKCGGTGSVSELCGYCNYFTGSKVTCSQCDGAGYIYRTLIVDYYE